MIAIVDYRAGNLTSVRLALGHLGIPSAITRDPAVVAESERVIFPGVGAAGAAMHSLADLGLSGALRQAIADRKPFLGICLGTQVIFGRSAEDGGVDCLGILPGSVQRFESADPLCKIPQMGWNTVEIERPHPVLSGIASGTEFYFVHSYYPVPADDGLTIGSTSYADVRFASVVGRDNLVAVQFHPERSGRYGLQLLANFARWEGVC
ncbi:MAG: imidazole glycerol phosphate synthase subunit HisH [Rhodospirillales bacterium]|nr:imidazole glycerol phosphate synthase subunit HisH [Rhodospirillales bacterium]